jgi:hypothetical protein
VSEIQFERSQKREILGEIVWSLLFEQWVPLQAIKRKKLSVNGQPSFC